MRPSKVTWQVSRDRDGDTHLPSLVPAQKEGLAVVSLFLGEHPHSHS